jgi:hypothetical protein
MIVSIDPGTHEAGVAQWKDARLQTAYLVRVTSDESWLWLANKVAQSCFHLPVSAIVLERPQVYVRSRAKGDPNDLITLALAAGAIAGQFNVQVIEYRPAEWKGQVPKEIMIDRIRETLDADERAAVELPNARSLAHNVWDAVGIGLHHFRRRYGGESL